MRERTKRRREKLWEYTLVCVRVCVGEWQFLIGTVVTVMPSLDVCCCKWDHVCWSKRWSVFHCLKWELWPPGSCTPMVRSLLACSPACPCVTGHFGAHFKWPWCFLLRSEDEQIGSRLSPRLLFFSRLHRTTKDRDVAFIPYQTDVFSGCASCKARDIKPARFSEYDI